VANALELNVGKCKSIYFSRLRHLVEFSNMWGGVILDHVDSIGRVLAMLEFLKRLSSDFRDPYTLTNHYVSLVHHPKLE
jgi:hypothetical protein